MASLREIKDRIGSVRSTLKITSAMKLVASAKLRKAQKAIEALRPYERTLAEILAAVGGAGTAAAPASLSGCASLTPDPTRVNGFAGALPLPANSSSAATNTSSAATNTSSAGTHTSSAGTHTSSAGLTGGSLVRRDAGNAATALTGPTAVVAIASNSSLCGGFNANVIRKTLETIRACEVEVEVFPLGRKMAEALRRNGFPGVKDYNDLIGHPSYEKSAALARELAERFQAGELSRVILVYNHFAAAASQVPTVEQYLPFEGIPGQARDDKKGVREDEKRVWDDVVSSSAGTNTSSAGTNTSSADLIGGSPADDYILEPDAEALVRQLLPQVLMLKFHAAILDSAAAEHAARTIAMQTASDNAEDLLGELTLEYNKGRQQKITAEILDLLGGAQ